MASNCIFCQMPLHKAYVARYPTDHERDLLRIFYTHLVMEERHSDQAARRKVEGMMTEALIVVFDSPIPDAPRIINVFWKKDLTICETFFCSETLVIPIPELKLPIMIELEMGAKSGKNQRYAHLSKEEMAVKMLDDYITKIQHSLPVSD